MKLNNKTIIFFIFVFSFCFLFSANEAFADEIDINIVNDVIQKFKENTSGWYAKLLNNATKFFAFALYFQLMWVGTKFVIEGTDTRQLLNNIVYTVFFGVMFLMFIHNYQEWTAFIVNGLSKDAVNLVGGNFEADKPFLIGITIHGKISKIIVGLNAFDNLGLIIALYVASFIIIIIFALITSRVVVIHCEILVGLLACSLIVPFGVVQTFRENAINAIRYIVSVGFKLFTMTLICGLAFTLFESFEFRDQGHLKDCMTLIASSMVLLAVVFTLPDTIASLISSAHGSAGGMLQAYNTVANATTAGLVAGSKIIGAAKGTVSGGAKGIMQGLGARNLAKETADDAWKGMSRGAKAWSTAKSWNSGRQQASMNHSPIHQELKNMVASIKAVKAAKELAGK